ncbi:hypothetical protein HD554DRAFT_2039145 [Boletus coccyginus]|nr:hypothetical protein HD554DRAFT_2039145 [Boletus coccyginus]
MSFIAAATLASRLGIASKRDAVILFPHGNSDDTRSKFPLGRKRYHKREERDSAPVRATMRTPESEWPSLLFAIPPAAAYMRQCFESSASRKEEQAKDILEVVYTHRLKDKNGGAGERREREWVLGTTYRTSAPHAARTTIRSIKEGYLRSPPV